MGTEAPRAEHRRSSTTSALGQTFKPLLLSQTSDATSENTESRGRVHRRDVSSSSLDRAASSLRETALPVLKRLKRSLSRSNHTPVAQDIDRSKTMSYRAREKVASIGRSFTLPARSGKSEAPDRHAARGPSAWSSDLNRATTPSHPDSKDRINVTTRAGVRQNVTLKQDPRSSKTSARDVSANVIDPKHQASIGEKATTAPKAMGTVGRRKAPTSNRHTRSSSMTSARVKEAPTLLSRSASLPSAHPTRIRPGSASTKAFSQFKALPSLPT